MQKVKTFLLSLAAVVAFFGTYAYAASYMKTDNIISTSGGPVGLPGGLTAPTTMIGDMYATTATITPTAVANLSTTIASPTFNVQRNGKMIHYWGLLNVAPVTSATLTTFKLTLPVSRSASFIGIGGATGSARVATNYSGSGTCYAVTNSKTQVTCSYISGTINADSVLVDVKYSFDAN